MLLSTSTVEDYILDNENISQKLGITKEFEKNIMSIVSGMDKSVIKLKNILDILDQQKDQDQKDQVQKDQNQNSKNIMYRKIKVLLRQNKLY